jgi:hypothetical protein
VPSLNASKGSYPGRLLKIYLLRIDHSRFFFYSDESDAAHDDEEGVQHLDQPAGVRGWFQARYRKFRSAWLHANSGALHWMRLAWEWLHSWTHPDEVMLSRLWSARRVDLHHPAGHAGGEVFGIWTDYLKKQWWRHLAWLTVNGTIAPFSAVLAILPGPNLIGYWFAYRAVHHALVVWGIRRVLRKAIPTEFHAVEALDVPVERKENGDVGHSALNGPATRLAEHVHWHNSSRRAEFSNHAFADAVPMKADPPIATVKTPETGDHAPIEL